MACAMSSRRHLHHQLFHDKSVLTVVKVAGRVTMIEREQDMNIVESNAETLAASQAPLFASSWMALFLLIREQLLLPAPDGTALAPHSAQQDAVDEEQAEEPGRH
jgi:hypothetical protein